MKKKQGGNNVLLFLLLLCVVVIAYFKYFRPSPPPSNSDFTVGQFVPQEIGDYAGLCGVSLSVMSGKPVPNEEPTYVLWSRFKAGEKKPQTFMKLNGKIISLERTSCNEGEAQKQCLEETFEADKENIEVKILLTPETDYVKGSLMVNEKNGKSKTIEVIGNMDCRVP